MMFDTVLSRTKLRPVKNPLIDQLKPIGTAPYNIHLR